ncbi:hypothetical protein ACIBXA_08775 [Micromonospora echinaurantiaca]|uniref:hypothetical protein n=1 Tax=Micromonospora TaxID=1873 RepID=UPI0011B6FE35|nr:hypothetical protein [Micromonospora sp. S4605]
MRRSLGDGWSIELPGQWQRGRGADGVTSWRAPGRTVRVDRGYQWRCATSVDVLAWLDAELPPDPVGKVGEAGGNGVGHRAAWLYRHTGEVRYTLHGYNFSDGGCLETVFTGSDAADLSWAFHAWRSVAHSPTGDGEQSVRDQSANGGCPWVVPGGSGLASGLIGK